MEIKGKVHLFFEQSGTFKNEFRKLGYDAEDYDIQNNFGETDYVIDLFAEIEKAYENKPSVFDNVKYDDLIIAFFPCIYFCENNQLYFTGVHANLQRLTKKDKYDVIIKRENDRARMYVLALKMFAVCEMRGLRLIVENPYAAQHYLVNNFPYKATIIDYDRTKRGDIYKKPTQYYFVNCSNANGYTEQYAKQHKKIASGKASGVIGGGYLLGGTQYNISGLRQELHLRLHSRQAAARYLSNII